MQSCRKAEILFQGLLKAWAVPFICSTGALLTSRADEINHKGRDSSVVASIKAQHLQKFLWATKPQNFTSSLWFLRRHCQHPPQNKHRLLLWSWIWFSLSPPRRCLAFGSEFQSCPAHFPHPLPPLGFLSAGWFSWKPCSKAGEERTKLVTEHLLGLWDPGRAQSAQPRHVGSAEIIPSREDKHSL